MELTSHNLFGTLPAIATPFSQDGSEVDYKSLEKLLEYQLKAGVNGIVVCGSTGEAATLSAEEYRSVVKFVKESVSGKVPVIAGVGVNSTQRGVELATLCSEIGVDGLLVVVPYYNKPPQQGVLAHFETIKKATKLPIIAYNVPGRTACNLTASTLKTLADNETIIGVKEASGNMTQMMEYLSQTRSQIAVLSGEDNLVYSCMCSGGRGTISASANVIPELFVEVTDACRNHDYEKAMVAQERILPVFNVMFMETNPMPVKAALALKGVIAHDTMRLPLVPVAESTKAKIREVLGL
ncbi:MAG: 4-hydroxy-tetrahydrodipicolinate synthase [Deltaproteobacteria bacterium]|nr:4-hydroxy-tetrahydrodipicolinate synthase [Deltaproteobacteria bacterium]